MHINDDVDQLDDIDVTIELSYLYIPALYIKITCTIFYLLKSTALESQRGSSRWLHHQSHRHHHHPHQLH